MKRGLPIVISAPSGAGKGTVIPLVMQALPDAAYSISCTTRGPRPGEQDGVNYHFISEKDFEARVRDGQMLEYNRYVDHMYGTPKEQTERWLSAGTDVVFEIDVNGAMHIKESLPEAVLIMLLPPDYATLEARLRGRGTDDDAIVRQRLEAALTEIEYLPRYDYFVINHTGKAEEAARQILAIITAERHACGRCPDFVKEFKAKI